MWENINGEYIWIDKELGADEYARLSMEQRNVYYVDDHRSNAGRGLSASGVALGVAGGIVGAKVVGSIGGRLFCILLLITFLILLG